MCRALSKKYGKVRLAVIYDNPDRQGKPIYCFTRMLTWNAQKIVQLRCYRWAIEPLPERIQQFLGAEDSPLQTEAGVQRHLTRVFVVNSLLKSLDLSQPIGDLPMTEFQNVSPTFGQRCRRILLEVFHDTTWKVSSFAGRQGLRLSGWHQHLQYFITGFALGKISLA